MLNGRTAARLVSMSRSGRHVALASPAGIDIVDALGTSPRHTVPRPGDGDFACVGTTLWVVGGATIQRWSLDAARALAPDVELPFAGAQLRPVPDDQAGTVLVVGARVGLAAARGDKVGFEELDGLEATSWPLAARRVLRAGPDGVRVHDVGRGDTTRLAPLEGAPLGAWPLFGGRAIAILVRCAAADELHVCRPDGGLIHRIAIPAARAVAVAHQRGTAVVAAEDGSLLAVDLRYGRIAGERAAPIEIVDLDVDAGGLYAALAAAPDGGPARVVHLAMTELFAGASPARAAVADPTAAAAPSPPSPPSLAGRRMAPVAVPAAVDAAAVDPAPPVAEAEAAPPPPAAVVISDLAPLAFGRPLPPVTAQAVAGVLPYRTPLEHFDALMELVAALAGRAIAAAWHSGRLSATADDPRPFQREVHALLGASGQLAGDEVGAAERRVAELGDRLAARARTSLACWLRLPVIDLARELELSQVATQVLAVAIGPLVSGEIARLYGILSNDESRPQCDAMLIEQIIAGSDPVLRNQVKRELADGSPLVRFGLVRIDTERRSRLFAPISVDGVLIERLRGEPPAAGLGAATALRDADRELTRLHAPPELLDQVVVACADARDAAAPLRLVLRGRRGSGRTSVIAALAARLGRRVSLIDCERMPRGGARIAATLRAELFRALLRGTVPVVSGLEPVDAEDAEGQDLIRQVVRAHPGPVIVRASPEATVLLDPGHLSFTLPALSESERVEVWREALADEGLPCGDVDALAARYRIGPGTIVAVVRSVATRRRQERVAADLDAGPRLDETARQHITTRLDRVASHVTRLAGWEEVALPDDVLDSLREFIGRIRHRRTVYETWGFDRKMSTSRGLTALFYGPPGTGKSMVAGLIARELGLELYRVDLARVVSKWIGETEKNLAEVFDAAEDGQVVVLFDEADSLFAKRTEVKSSVDRYANLEVNYLLQRLDSFEGIAILTTNLEGSIDPAFKRRMSLRLQFPFPDEEISARLWAAHLPPEAPVTGDLDFAELAHRFPLSGGYIRNSAIRAAFLAAQEDRPLSFEHLVRAIQLEYREMGKLSSSGRME